MKSLLAILFLLSSPALADGFLCENTREGLVVKVFNKDRPATGVRHGAAMILSDSSVTEGNRTIARFIADETLTNAGANYSARVDHRYNDSNRKGERLAGTNIGNLKTILLSVDFDYETPVRDGARLEALLTLVQRNGGVIELDLDCARYLKN